MIIRFTSSLTPDDENMLAPSLLKALTSMLDLFPIAYSVRIDTTGSEIHQHSSLQKAGAVASRLGEVTMPPPRYEES